jgi:hypothetical protein
VTRIMHISTAWLLFKLGDQNNAYFLHMVMVRRPQSSIKYLWHENGVKVEEVDKIKCVAENYYQKLLGTSPSTLDDLLAAHVEQLVSPTLTEVQKTGLIQPVSADKIKWVVF